MKRVWTGRVAQAAEKYGENAPMATVCCNACRTCVTTNIVGVAMAAIAGAGYTVSSSLAGTSSPNVPRTRGRGQRFSRRPLAPH